MGLDFVIVWFDFCQHQFWLAGLEKTPKDVSTPAPSAREFCALEQSVASQLSMPTAPAVLCRVPR